MKTFKLPKKLGSIHSVAEDAIAFANLKAEEYHDDVEVQFEFNDIVVSAYNNSNVFDVAEKFFLQNTIRQLKA